MSHSDQVEKTNYDRAQDLLEKYADPDAGVIPDKVAVEVQNLKLALQEERKNAAAEVEILYQSLTKLSGDGKIKGGFVAGSDNEFDCYHLEADAETAITLVLIPAASQYEWKFEEGMQFGASTLPAFDALHRDLAVIRKTNLLNRLFNAVQADHRNPDAINRLDALLANNAERKQRALVAEWRETLEYVLADLKDARSGKSVFIDQPFSYTRNGRTKSYKILRADRTGLVVMIDEELELDRKFSIDSYAYDLIVAFMPLLVKHKGKSPSAKQAARGSRHKSADRGPESSPAANGQVDEKLPPIQPDQPGNA